MIWGQSDRFKKAKDGSQKSFTNIGEYIRYQFQLSKNKFKSIDYWMENTSPKAEQIKMKMSSPSKRKVVPESNDTTFALTQFDESSTREDDVFRKSNDVLRKNTLSTTQLSELNQRLTKPLRSTIKKRLGNDTLNMQEKEFVNSPGPMSYDTTINLVKQTHNRKKYEPKTKKNNTTQENYEMQKRNMGAFMNYNQRYLSASAPELMKINNKPKVKAIKVKQNLMLENKRYPNNDREGFNAEYSREWTTEQRVKFKWFRPTTKLGMKSFGKGK